MIEKEIVVLLFFVWFVVGFLSMTVGSRTVKDLTILGRIVAGPFVLALYAVFIVQDILLFALYKNGGK